MGTNKVYETGFHSRGGMGTGNNISAGFHMVKTSKGFKSSTRNKLSKRYRDKFTITPYLQDFKDDDKVVVMIDPSSQKGQPHSRFKGHIGIVHGKRGRSYLVKVKIGNKTKEVISAPEHLKLYTGVKPSK